MIWSILALSENMSNILMLKNETWACGLSVAYILLFLFRLCTWNLFLCWQAEAISEFLLSKHLHFWILSFTFEHKLHHLFDPLVHEIEFLSIN